MVHLVNFNESAARGWRPVSRGDFRRAVDGQEADVFLPEEAEEARELLMDLVPVPTTVWVVENSLSKPGSEDEPGPPIRLRTDDHGRVLDFFAHHDNSHMACRKHVRGTLARMPFSEEYRPGTPAHQLDIVVFGVANLEVTKSADDYFFVHFSALPSRRLFDLGHGVGHYVCDRKEGLASLLRHLLGDKAMYPGWRV